MEESTGVVMQFLKEFTAEKISPTSDDDVQIRCGIVGSYSLKPKEIDGEVTDWVLNYLELRKCPYFLAIALAKKVAQQISTMACKRLLQSNGENIGDEDTLLQNATSLHTEAIGRLRELCCELQDHPEQIETSWAQPLRFEASVFAIKNGRRKMEDRHVMLHDLNAACNLLDAPNHSYYAVFDGHAGVETASFASAHLHTNLVQHPAFLKDTKTAIIEAFKLTDTQFAERATRENLKSGATAVCALIRESTLYIAWVGDSQALLVKQGKPYAIMNPHKPEREDEKKRIEDLGGYIYHHGTWRVNGTLAVSRALGDAEHKPFVSNEPEINVIDLDGSEDFLVIACDGLWDKMSADDVSISLYRHLADNPQDADSIAAKLVHQSKLMGSSDNITTIVVFLRDIQSLIADSPKYTSMFPQLEGINVSPISQIANGTAGKNYDPAYEISDKNFENKYQRPTYFSRDLDFSNVDPSDWSPDSHRMHHELHGQNGKYCVAEGMPPEQTSLSELPTPPIDEVVASKQFSEYSSSEQLKIFQEHLEAQGFHDVSLSEIQTSMTENLQFLPSEMQEGDMGYLADEAHGEVAEIQEIPGLPFEDLSDNLQDRKSDATVFTNISADVIGSQIAQDVSPEDVFNTASDLVLNTIETAVKQVSSGDSNIELNTCVPEKLVSHNPFQEQELDIVDSCIPSPIPVKSSHQLNPNAEPFVMKDFTFNPDTMVSTSQFHSGGTGNIDLFDLSSSDMSGHAVTNSPDVSSPVPSAPPLEALNEGQRTYASGEYVVEPDNMLSSDHSNRFYSDLLKNGGVDTKIQSALTEVSTARELDSQLLLVHGFEEQPLIEDSQLNHPLPVHKPTDQHVLSLDTLEQPSSPTWKLPAQPSSPTQELSEQLSSPTQQNLKEPLHLAQELLVQPLSVAQELMEHPVPVQELVEQPVPVQELVEQPAPVQESVEQPAPVQELVEQPAPVQELVEQPAPVQESVEQPMLGQESVEQPPPVVAQESVKQSAPVHESVEEPPSAVAQTSVEQLPSPSKEPVDQLLVQPDVQQFVSSGLLANNCVDEPLPEHSLLHSDKQVLVQVDLNKLNKSDTQLGEITQNSLFELDVAPVDDSENKSLLAAVSVLTEDSSAFNQTTVFEDVSLISDSSMDPGKSLVESEPPQPESISSVNASDDIISGDSTVEDVSKQVTHQVIGKDSLLPKEVQEKLLEVTSATLPSESVAEDAPVGAVAVDLKTIPDGVPEAEGVTEDSDSEKDGGWSYVKASNSSQDQKAVKKTVDANKMASKKAPVASVKDKKMVGKIAAGDTRSKLKGTAAGVADATKKVAPEKTDKKPTESKDKKDRPTASLKTTTQQPLASKTSDRKPIKKTVTTTTVPRSIPSKPSTITSTSTVKQPPSSTASKPSSSVTNIRPEKLVGKPMHSSTPFRPPVQKPAPSVGTSKPLTRPASATASHTTVTSSVGVSKPSGSSLKPQPRASSAPLASKTTHSTKVNATESKSSTAGAEVKPKPSGTTFRKPLPPPAKKPDVKETKDSTNKQILAKKTTLVSSTTQVRRTGASTSTLKVDSVSKKSSMAVASDTKTLRMPSCRTDVAKSNTISKAATARSRMTLPSKQPTKSSKPESDKKVSEAKQNKNGPKKIADDTTSSDQKCSPDNRMQEVIDEKGMLEVNAQKAADDQSAGASMDPLIDVPASEIVSKSELKQESNVIECPVPVTAAAEEKV